MNLAACFLFLVSQVVFATEINQSISNPIIDDTNVFLKSGVYLYDYDTNTKPYGVSVVVSEGTSPFITLSKRPDGCGTINFSGKLKAGFIFECEASKDDCPGYALSDKNIKGNLKRIGSNGFIIIVDGDNKSMLFTESAGVTFTSTYSSKTKYYNCPHLKESITFDMKNDCKHCSGKVNDLKIDFSESTFTSPSMTGSDWQHCVVVGSGTCFY